MGADPRSCATSPLDGQAIIQGSVQKGTSVDLFVKAHPTRGSGERTRGVEAGPLAEIALKGGRGGADSYS